MENTSNNNRKIKLLPPNQKKTPKKETTYKATEDHNLLQTITNSQDFIESERAIQTKPSVIEFIRKTTVILNTDNFLLERMSTHYNKSLMIILGLISNIGNLVVGYYMVCYNVIYWYIKDYYGIYNENQYESLIHGSVSALFIFGMMFGSYFSKYISKKSYIKSF